MPGLIGRFINADCQAPVQEKIMYLSLIIIHSISTFVCEMKSGVIFSLTVFLSSYCLNLSPQVQLPGPVPTLVGELEPFFWTRWPVLGMRPDWWTVKVIHLVFIIVATMKMLGSRVGNFLVNIM